jgi:hypothetical protein
MANQDSDFKWFQENMKSLYLDYPEKFLIISNYEIKGAEDNFNNALQQALKSMKAGEFIIQQCTKEDLVCHYSNTAVIFA